MSNSSWANGERSVPGGLARVSHVEAFSLAWNALQPHGPMLTTILLARRPTGTAPSEELACDPETAAHVDRRGSKYFPAGGVEMGDSDRGHLD